MTNESSIFVSANVLQQMGAAIKGNSPPVFCPPPAVQSLVESPVRTDEFGEWFSPRNAAYAITIIHAAKAVQLARLGQRAIYL